MNKLALAAAAVLFVALLALPPVVGGVTEARVRERVAVIDADPRAGAQIQSYERGWFRSTVRLELGLLPDGMADAADAAGTPLGAFGSLPIVVEYAHGPIAVLDGVHFGWAKMVARADTAAPGVGELEQTLGVPYLFEFRGRSGYLAGLDFDADAPPFELPIGEALLTFSGATIAGNYAAPRLRADAHLGGALFASPTGTFGVRDVHVSTDNELLSRYVMPGTASFSVASISVVDAFQAATPMLEATNVVMGSTAELDSSGELLAMRVTYDVDSLRLLENELTAGSLAVALRNLDVAAVEAYGAAATDAAGAGADPVALMAALGPHLERALRAGPSLAFDPIRFRYDGEPFDGRIELTTNTARLPAAGTLSLDNPLFVLGLFDVRADLRVSKVLAGELAALTARMQLGADDSIPPDQLEYMVEAQSGLMLTMLVGQGVLIEEGDGYRSSLAYTNGAITLNGSPLPFALQ